MINFSERVPARSLLRMSKGSVLLFSLMIMGVVTLLTEQLIKSVSVGLFFTRSMVLREKAEMVTLGGVSLAIAQLQKVHHRALQKEGSSGSGKAKSPEGSGTQQSGNMQFNKRSKFKSGFVKEILPHLNRWQKFKLDEDIDGVDADLKICIVSEHGKLPINQLFDHRKQDLKKPIKELLKRFSVKKKLAAGALVAKLTAFFKKQKETITDISQLTELAEQLKIPLYYQPPEWTGSGSGSSSGKRGKSRKEATKSRLISLQDLFTTWDRRLKLPELLLSDSISAVAGLRRPQADDAVKLKEKFATVSKSFVSVGKKHGLWSTYQQLYESKPQLAKEVTGLFSSEFEPTIYSVLSCGNVAGVQQKLLAIIEKQRGKIVRQAPQKGRKSQMQGPPEFTLKRLYWL